MSTSFVSVQGNNIQGWGVVVKTFPILREPKSLSPLSVPTEEREVSFRAWDYAVKVVTVGAPSFVDQEMAEIAGKAMAKSAGFEFVPYNTNIVVLGPLPGKNINVIPYELKLDGNPGIQLFGPSGPFLELIERAKNLAKEKSLAFLYPNSFDINKDLTFNCSDRTAFDVTGDTSEPLFSVINLAEFLKNPSGGPALGSSVLEPLIAAGLLVPAAQLIEVAGKISKSLMKEIPNTKEKILILQKWQRVFESIKKEHPNLITGEIFTHLKQLEVGPNFSANLDKLVQRFNL